MSSAIRSVKAMSMLPRQDYVVSEGGSVNSEESFSTLNGCSTVHKTSIYNTSSSGTTHKKLKARKRPTKSKRKALELLGLEIQTPVLRGEGGGRGSLEKRKAQEDPEEGLILAIRSKKVMVPHEGPSNI